MKKLITILLLTLTLTACEGEVLTQNIEPLSLKQAKEIALAHGFINEKQADFITEEFIDEDDYYLFIIKEDDTNHVYKIDANNGKILLSSDKESDDAIKEYTKVVEKEQVSTTEKTETKPKPVVPSTKDPVKTETPKQETPKQETPRLKNITKDKAIELALNNAGLSKSQVTSLEVEEDDSKNRKVYEVEFYHGDYEYEYKYAISDGTLIKKEIDFEGTTGESNPLTIAQAKEKALSRVKGANDNHIRIKEDIDDGRKEYEGKIIYGSYEYEFEIDAQSGIFLEWEQEILY